MKRAIPFGVLVGVMAVAAPLVHADGEITAEARSVPAFEAIELLGSLVVDAKIGTPARVEVYGETDLLDQVETTVKNGTLVISNKERHTPLRSKGPRINKSIVHRGLNV